MAALDANLSALRVGVTEGGQVVVEVEHRKLVTPYITNDVENPKEFPGSRMDLGRSSNISKEWPALGAIIFSIALRLIPDTGDSLSGALPMPGLAEPQSGYS